MQDPSPALFSSENRHATSIATPTDAIIDDSNTKAHLDSWTDTSHADSPLKTAPLIQVIYSGIFGEGLETARNSPFPGILCRSSMQQ